MKDGGASFVASGYPEKSLERRFKKGPDLRGPYNLASVVDPGEHGVGSGQLNCLQRGPVLDKAVVSGSGIPERSDNLAGVVDGGGVGDGDARHIDRRDRARVPKKPCGEAP